jgi:shikimate kinase
MTEKINWKTFTVQEIHEKLELMKEYKSLLTPNFKKLKKEDKVKKIENFEKKFEKKLNELMKGKYLKINLI